MPIIILYNLFSYREAVIRPGVIHGSLIVREAGMRTACLCTSLSMSLTLF